MRGGDRQPVSTEEIGQEPVDVQGALVVQEAVYVLRFQFSAGELGFMRENKRGHLYQVVYGLLLPRNSPGFGFDLGLEAPAVHLTVVSEPGKVGQFFPVDGQKTGVGALLVIPSEILAAEVQDRSPDASDKQASGTMIHRDRRLHAPRGQSGLWRSQVDW